MSENNGGPKVVIKRTFNASREAVWKAWTESARLAQWWGPKGFGMNVAKFELKPEGMFLYSMTPPGGSEIWGKFLYKEVVAPQKLVFINSFTDKDGNNIRNPWISNWPLEVMNTLTLEEKDGKTFLTLQGGPINATDEELKIFDEGSKSMEQGFAGTWEKLDEFLAKNS